MVYYLTYPKLPKLPPNEHKIVDFLSQNQLQVRILDWHQLDCSSLTSEDVVLLRSTWDYDFFPDEFRAFLKQLNQSQAIVLNNPELMLWNMDKRYMFTFQELRLPVIPTFSQLEKQKLLRNHTNTESIIAKPVFSAGARGLKRFTRDEFLSAELEPNYIYQPFVPSIPEVGEWSLLYVNGTYSHAVLKKAKAGDFRVQSDYGGTFSLVDVDKEWIELGSRFLDLCPHKPFFARVDLVLWENKPVLIELEVIEPELFFMNDTIVSKWANEILKHIKH
ncbi:hypothetical protein EP331_14185 [bacterium]|nr:MAG: hypothetical protein EP331_14185 [bacterium]